MRCLLVLIALLAGGCSHGDYARRTVDKPAGAAPEERAAPRTRTVYVPVYAGGSAGDDWLDDDDYPSRSERTERYFADMRERQAESRRRREALIRSYQESLDRIDTRADYTPYEPHVPVGRRSTTIYTDYGTKAYDVSPVGAGNSYMVQRIR